MLLTELLRTLPGEIRDAEDELCETERDIAEIERRMKSWELAWIKRIAEATNGDGKPLYSNEAKRQAELARRKEDDPDWRDMTAQWKRLIEKRDQTKVEFHYQRNKLRSAEALAMLITAGRESFDIGEE